ncbi:hypothetical protein MUK76_26080 (plasmid) [Escherichia coli]|nr:hypothetical protein [Escherichia coli]UOQ32878.1 hypothetical protein MUK76_26080 [Escherichia coli]
MSHVLEGASQEDLNLYRAEVERDQAYGNWRDFFLNKKGSVTSVSGDANLDQIADVSYLLDTFFAKVTRTALQNAASIAGLMITTEAMVAEARRRTSRRCRRAAAWVAWAAWISDAVGPVVREPDRASAVRSRQRPDIKAPRTGPEPGSDAGLFVVPAPRQCLTRRSERTDTNVRTQVQP